MKKILVTGGAGYIGSHTCVSLIEAGYSVVIVDDFSNSRMEVVDRIEEITGTRPIFYLGDVTKREDLEPIFAEHEIGCAIHFAGKKAVKESVTIPLAYYETNIMSTISLCNVMRDHGVKDLVFSSSATVYGESEDFPFTESSPRGNCTNPYGWTKWMIEQILQDLYVSDPEWSIRLLRYFNPVGAHESGRIGEDPKGLPNNLMPNITQVAVGRIDSLKITGNDYPTHDGTGVRDYIHVVDLADGHVAAVQDCMASNGTKIYNLGTGVGYSVLDVVHAFEKVLGRKLPVEFLPRREGDIATSYASTAKAERELGWRAKRGIDKMCADAWRWQSNNPEGYANS